MLRKSLITSWMEYSIPIVELGIWSRSLCIISCHGKHEIPAEGRKPEPGISENPQNSVEVICKLLATKPWTTEVENQLSSAALSLTTATVIDILSNSKTSLQAYRFFNWTQANGFKHDIRTYFKILEILGRGRHLNSARTLLLGMRNNGVVWEDCVFNSLIRSYGRAGVIQDSIGIFKKMKEVGVPPTVLTYNNLFTVLLKRGRTNMAKKYYTTMVSEGVLPDVYTYNILIRGFCLSSKVDAALGYFQDMRKRECSPDIVTYNTLLDGLCKNGRVQDAYKLWKGMSKTNPDLVPNVVTYTTMIRGFCRKDLVDEALKLLNEMVCRGVSPNEITYNIITQALCDANKLEETHRILQDMIQGNFKPDTCTYNILMNAQCNAGNLEEAEHIFYKMRELGVCANSATYSVIIRSLYSRGEFDKAVELLDDLLQKGILLEAGSCVPLVAAYNPMFAHLCKHGKTEKAEKLFWQLLKQGIQDPSTFKTLILGHCKEGTPEAGFELLKIMLRRNYSPDIDTYNALMQSFLQKGQPANARNALDRMLERGHMPMASTFHMLIDSLFRNGKVRAASRVMKTMLEKDVRQDIDVSTKVLSALLCQDLAEEAFERIELLYDKGYLPDMDKLFSDLCQKHKYPEAQRLLEFVLQKDCYLDSSYYNTVLDGLCVSGKATQAFSLFYRMTEKGRKPDLRYYEMLVISLQEEGKLKEAEFVSRRLKSIDGEGETRERGLCCSSTESINCRLKIGHNRLHPSLPCLGSSGCFGLEMVKGMVGNLSSWGTFGAWIKG